LYGAFRVKRLFWVALTVFCSEPDLPPDTAWASDASDQRIFILRRHRLTVAVSNETDHPMDLLALNQVVAAAIAAWA